jgi:hypothetical protein
LTGAITASSSSATTIDDGVVTMIAQCLELPAMQSAAGCLRAAALELLSAIFVGASTDSLLHHKAVFCSYHNETFISTRTGISSAHAAGRAARWGRLAAAFAYARYDEPMESAERLLADLLVIVQDREYETPQQLSAQHSLAVACHLTVNLTETAIHVLLQGAHTRFGDDGVASLLRVFIRAAENALEGVIGTNSVGTIVQRVWAAVLQFPDVWYPGRALLLVEANRGIVARSITVLTSKSGTSESMRTAVKLVQLVLRWAQAPSNISLEAASGARHDGMEPKKKKKKKRVTAIAMTMAATMRGKRSLDGDLLIENGRVL